jgi:hypothetical protein
MEFFKVFLERDIFAHILMMSLYSSVLYSQVPDAQAPSISPFSDYARNGLVNPSNNRNQVPVAPSLFNPNLNRQQQQNKNIMLEVEQNQKLQEQAMKEARADIEELRDAVRYTLPTYSKFEGTQFYYEAFEKIILLDTTFSLKENNFLVENAYFGNTLDKAEFDKIITQSADFIRAKMKEQDYDQNSNAAKNFMLFQFFSETLQLKSSNQKHFPFKYDFDDYRGVKNYAKMFVTKLLATKTGQCHSMPLLYLILADEIKAEAYLALSPNHSYIRFPDDKGKWYNIELTNGMLSTDSYISQSGYIKSEALQNKIYMENLTKKEILSGLLTDLADGYIHKFGHDEFVKTVIDKALELSPKSIRANMIKSNLDSARMDFVLRQVGKRPLDNYPQALDMIEKVKSQYSFIDQLGYEDMPEEAYQEWLQSMTKENQKQKNEELTKQLKKALSNKKSTIKE